MTNFYQESALLSNLAFLGRPVSSELNPAVQKDKTYRILSRKYEEQLRKYNTATEAQKQTQTYERLEAIVFVCVIH